MSQAKQGDTVKIHYTGRLQDGTVFDSSAGRDPLEFMLGSGMVIPGFDQGVTGMAIGEKREIHIPFAQAYGPHRPELQLDVSRSDFPADLELQPGLTLQLLQPTGEAVLVTVVSLNDETASLDANHPLAGKDLTFELELMAIA